MTHTLVGWALAETGLKHRTRKGLAACVLAANLPDIDVFFGWVPWAPLAMHRGFTHGLVGGVLLLPPFLALLLWLLDRWQRARGKIAKDALPMRFGWLLALCWLGAISHPLLDLQNVYAVQLLSPASERWFHSDGLFIVSPWVLVFLGIGIWRSRKRSAGRPAILALAATVLFVLANVAISALAWRAPLLEVPHVQPDRIFASPEPFAFWRRDMVWRADGAITQGSFDPLVSMTRVSEYGEPVADNMNVPVVRRAAIATPEVRDFLAWSQMPMASIARKGCAVTVIFGDARFSTPVTAGGFQESVRLQDC
ncbi:metal-dependent hydrolase [Novosphingobium sp. AAP83]|uniref:metal-dependent hydrolase n=1 Tax=Novosphingobium sp. AAP83 TaxID=1523425 RepID=UPI001E35DA3D|nr:metal-dependent hydrolase [Novosphingobium sp. AAP83]